MSSRMSNPLGAHQAHLPNNRPFDLINFAKELPESYKWAPDEHEHNYPSLSKTEQSELVPVIDLCNPNALNLIGEACKTWGGFQVVNHGVPTRLLEEVLGQTKSLFSLPAEQKLKAARSPGDVSGYGIAQTSRFFQKQMSHEGFAIFGSPVEHARLLWPQHHTMFCNVIEEYMKEMKRLAGELMFLILGSLGISKEEIEWAGDSSEASDVLQLNSYPVCPDPDRAMGLCAHTNSNLFTILYQGNVGGLQVLEKGAGWVTVAPVPNSLVINIGDLFQILSNGLYQSVMHRAVVNNKQHRFTLAYHHKPPSSVQISPVPKLSSPSRPLLYPPISWSEYIKIKGKNFNQTLSSIQLHDGPDSEAN